jgi:hypothetical protein
MGYPHWIFGFMGGRTAFILAGRSADFRTLNERLGAVNRPRPKTGPVPN